MLAVVASFDARHGTSEARQSTFEVTLTIRGSLVGDFIAGVDEQDLRGRLETELTILGGTRLDDIVGRATLENLAAYILMRLGAEQVESVSVASTGALATIAHDDIRSDRWSAELALKRGVSLLLRGDAEAALDAFTAAVRSAPSWAAPYNARGRCLRRLGHLHDALDDYERAISIAPAFAEAHRNRGNAILESSGGEEALHAFDEAIARDHDSAIAHNNRGYALGLAGDLDGALADHNRAIELDADYEEAYRDRAAVLRKLGRPDAALEDETRVRGLAESTDGVQLERAKLMASPELPRDQSWGG